MNRPEMSLVLTIISLGTRVALAYVLAPIPAIGVWGIWAAIPIGWGLADVTGLLMLRTNRRDETGGRRKGKQREDARQR